MRISVSWLRQWVEFDWPIETLVHRLSMAGLEVDEVAPAAPPLDKVVVGEIIECVKHPQADKLSICQVSVGTALENSQAGDSQIKNLQAKNLQIVCGAPNVCVGLKAPVAMSGATLPGGMTIKKSKLRGEVSEGMLCGGSEIGIDDSSDGLLELPKESEVGLSIESLFQLDDTVIDVDLTPNRADCLSMVGLAREVATLSGGTWKYPFDQAKEIEPAHQEVRSVILDAGNACTNYRGRIIKGIHNQIQSPIWLKEKLRRSGIRSINPVVDVTNYVMLELGQPMHAFDLEKIDRSICVRSAKADEKLILLDGREISLAQENTVIADEDGSIALAGIMGGASSAVLVETTDIFLEAAYFDPDTISGKARAFGLHTDSSHRFERGVSPELQEPAINRATELLLAIVGGSPGPMIKGEMKDKADREKPPAAIKLLNKNVERILGVALDSATIEKVLVSLGMQIVGRDAIDGQADSWEIVSPAFRFDIRLEIDLIEEIARVVGYENLPTKKLVSQPSAKVAVQNTVGLETERHCSIETLKMGLVSLGYSEIITYSFVDEKELKYLGLGDALVLKNPISSELKAMRTTLVLGLLNTLRYNQSRQKDSFQLFESGLRFEQGDRELTQTPSLSGLVAGKKGHEFWSKGSGGFNFFDLKGHICHLLELSFGADPGVLFSPETDLPFLHPGQSCSLMLDKERLGYMGAIHPKVLSELQINGPVFVFELNLALLQMGQLPNYQPLSKFPSVRRDLAFLLNESTLANDVCEFIASNAGNYLENVQVFDIYQGQGIEKGKKSGAFTLTFRHPSRTLKEEEINTWIEKLVGSLEQAFDATQRA